MRLRGNVASCYFSKASDQGQLGELVAKLCNRIRAIDGLVKKKKRRCFPAYNVDLILLVWGGLGIKINSSLTQEYVIVGPEESRHLKEIIYFLYI